MKRFLAAALAAIMIFSLAGCGAKTAEPTTAASQPTSETQAATTTQSETTAQDNTTLTLSNASQSTVDSNSGEAQLLARLQKAYNTQDLYGLMECFDPAIANASFAMMKLLGLDSDAYKAAMPFASKMIGQSGAMSDWGQVTLTALNIDGGGDDEVLTYQVDLSYPDGSSNSFEDTANIIRVDGTWYFSAFQPVVTSTVDYGPIPVNPDITEEDVEGELFIIGDKQHGPLGYINESGKEIVSLYFGDMQEFKGDYCAVSKGGKWGIIDRMGNLVIEYIFDDIKDYPSYGGWFSVKNENGWGAINPATGEAIECRFADIGAVGENGLVPVKSDGYWGIVTITDASITDYLYLSTESSYHADMLGVAINSAWGIIDANGEYLLQPAANRSAVEITDNGLIFVKEGDWNIYDSNMNLLFSEIYEYEQLAEDRILFRSKHSVLIDGKGNIIADSDTIAEQYFAAHSDELSSNDAYYGSISVPDYLNGLLEVHATAGYSSVINIIDYDGNLKLNEWFSGDSSGSRNLSASNDNSVLYAGSEFVYTDIFDLNTGNKLAELPFTIFHARQFGGTALCEGRRDGRDYDVIIDASGGDYTNYQEVNDISVFLNSGNWRNEYPIVTDGVFYGVYGPNGYLGNGLTYTSVNWDKNNQIYTLQVGANTERYRIGTDGTVNRLE